MSDSSKYCQSQPWIDGFAFQSPHSENALVNTPQRLFGDEPLENFEPQGKFTRGERALGI